MALSHGTPGVFPVRTHEGTVGAHDWALIIPKGMGSVPERDASIPSGMHRSHKVRVSVPDGEGTVPRRVPWRPFWGSFRPRGDATFPRGDALRPQEGASKKFEGAKPHFWGPNGRFVGASVHLDRDSRGKIRATRPLFRECPHFVGASGNLVGAGAYVVGPNRAFYGKLTEEDTANWILE